MQITRRTTFLAGIGAAAAADAQASPAQPGAYRVPFSDVLPLRSRINGIRYLLYVRTPTIYAANPAERFPVIVTLDADYSFSLCANHLEHLSLRQNQGPHAILVSIAVAGVYPDLDRYHIERTRDYSPIYVEEAGVNTPFQHVSGGGVAFQRVVAEEVLPLIDARYRTATNERTLVGHSLGGLFACWTLQTRPELFNRFLVVSPSLWYGNKWIFDREAEHVTTRLARETRVYFGVGSWEEAPEQGRFMASECMAFASLLAARGDANLVVGQRIFEDETHASIFPSAFSTGIRHLFANRR